MPLSAVEWGCHLRQSGTKLVLDVFVAQIYFLFCARVIKLRYGYNILFAHKTQERICACVYQGAVFRSEDQHTSVDQSHGFYSEVEFIPFEQKFQEHPLFAGGACAV